MARILTKPIKSQDLLTLKSLEYLSGPENLDTFLISTADRPEKDSLVFISDNDSLKRAIDRNVKVIILSTKIRAPDINNCLIFHTRNISQSLADVLRLADSKGTRIATGKSRTAVIEPGAQVADSTNIGEFAVVGAGAIVEENVTLSHHVVVEKGARIGRGSFLHPFVVVGENCVLGANVEIHSHSVVGSDGFGLVTQADGRHEKIPQIGIVVIEDNVEIGANCAIDRATIDETRICKGTKFDNFVHIAHNCRIGENSRIAAGFFLAGSSSIGSNFLTGGSSVVADHVAICNDVTLAGKSAVTKDIVEPGAYGGYPLEPLKLALKNIASISKLTDLRKQISQIRKHLGLESQKEE